MNLSKELKGKKGEQIIIWYSELIKSFFKWRTEKNDKSWLFRRSSFCKWKSTKLQVNWCGGCNRLPDGTIALQIGVFSFTVFWNNFPKWNGKGIMEWFWNILHLRQFLPFLQNIYFSAFFPCDFDYENYQFREGKKLIRSWEPPPPFCGNPPPPPKKKEGCDRIWKWWTDSLITTQLPQAGVREVAGQWDGGCQWRGWTSHKPPEVHRGAASCSFDAGQLDGLPYLRAAAEPEGRWGQLQPEFDGDSDSTPVTKKYAAEVTG